MANLQRRLAASVLKVGENKVWMDPAKREDIVKAITRADVRKLVMKKFIKKMPQKIKMPGKVGAKRRNEGGRKGSKNSIVVAKRKWINTIRPLRSELKSMKTQGSIENSTYKRMRLLIKGGMFRSRSHLKIYMEQHGLLKKK